MVSLFDAIRPLQMTVYRAYAGGVVIVFLSVQGAYKYCIGALLGPQF